MNLLNLNVLEALSNDSLHKWIVLSMIILVIVGLFKNILKPSYLFFFAVVLLIILGVISPQDFLDGFGNKSIATIILLIILSSAVNRSFNIYAILDKLFAHSKTPRSFLLRMTTVVAFLSSLMNNTPVVATMTPYVYNWCKHRGAHPSKLLIPLSFATILGGMITIIGTSTNLVLNGFIEDNHQPSLGFQDFLYLGLLVTFFGIIYLYTIGYELLPEKKDAFDDAKAIAPEYLIETQVALGSKLVNTKVSESGVQGYNGAYLIELQRGDEIITPIPPDFVLQADDRLMFMGKTENIMKMVNAQIGLQLPKHEQDLEIVEALIPANSTLAGRIVADIEFKENYDAEILAIHRSGEKLSGAIHEKQLESGDLLLISAGDHFLKNIHSNKDIYVLSNLGKNSGLNKTQRISLAITALIGLGGIFTSSFGIFTAALLLMGALIAMKVLSFREISKEIDADLLILLVSALALGNAFINSGASEMISNIYIKLLLPLGNVGILIGLFVITTLLTSFVTNVAAVSIAFPIAYSVSQQLHIEGTPFYICIAFAASAAFLTPVSYQTNWMVYGPGGYTPKDFLRTGLPLTIIYTTICITFITLHYNLIW